MRNYEWNIEKIRQNYQEIAYLINKSSDKGEVALLRESLSFYDGLLKACSIYKNNNDEEDDLLLQGTIKKKLMTIKNFYNKDFKNMCLSIMTDIRRDYECVYNELPYRKMSSEEAVNLNKEFYRTIDPEIYEEVEYVLNPKRKLLQINENEREAAFCYMDYLKKEPYIIVNNNSTMAFPIALNHELGHAFSFVMNPAYYSYDLYTDTLVETTSLFSQLLFYDFLRSKGFNIYEVNSCEINDLFCYFLDFRLIGAMLKLSKISKKTINRNINGIDLGILEEFDTFNSMPYFISFMVAIQFVSQYHEDKQYGLYNLKKFIRSDKRDNLDDILENSDINIYNSGEFVKKYTQKLKGL